MRIVSDNSSADLRRRAAERQLGFALRALAANMLRIIRGAGKSYQLPTDLADCLVAMKEFEEAYDDIPPLHIIERALDPERSWPDGADEREHCRDAWSRNPPEDEALVLQKQSARRQMRLAALRITASMLADQHLQLAHGDDDLDQAIARHERLNEELRALRAKEARGVRAGQKVDHSRLIATALALSAQGPKSRLTPALAEQPPPPPDPSRQAHDQLQPPSYEGLRVVALPDAFAEEFGVASALDLVLWLNRLRRERGVAPLPQRQFPSNRATLDYVVKELRKERGR